MECTIVLKKLLGEGGEGAAYKILLKNNTGTEKNGLACKEFNYLKHEGDPSRIVNFMSKIYSEYKMVQDL